MAYLLIQNTVHSAPSRSVALTQAFTTLGQAMDSEIVLDGAGVEAHHAVISWDGKYHHIAPAHPQAVVQIHGKKVRSHKLRDGDQVEIGSCRVGYSTQNMPQVPVPPGQDSAFEDLRDLINFSERLMQAHDHSHILEEMMDALVELFRADKAFLILAEAGGYSVKVARNIHNPSRILPQPQEISDSIVKTVLETRKPIIVSNALEDRQFQSSLSVINLRLCSVMCTPLLARGDFLGLIYLGNDRVANLFTTAQLERLNIFAAQAALLIRNAQLLNELELDNKALREKLQTRMFGELLGSCESMQKIFARIQKVAATDVSVLVTGETGTGKELIAQELHRRSNRHKGPFVAINCGAIPANLLESELFGHMRGAFTGAVQNKPGKFEDANGGTLFLDEIGELAPSLQVKLLRAIQEREVLRVGDAKPRPIDIRVITATHRNLEEAIAEGRFREDLYYRLNVINLHLPPLRERDDDVTLLARWFLERFTAEYRQKERTFSKDALVALCRYRWPGNVRELENRIKKAVILAESGQISPADMELQPADLEPLKPLAEAKEDFQSQYIRKALVANNGNRTQTAKDLGVDVRTIFRFLEREQQEETP